MYYWFTFEDGHIECGRGYNRTELKHMELKHGKLRRKAPTKGGATMRYWFTFEDGHEECSHGYSRTRFKDVQSKHGKLVYKERA